MKDENIQKYLGYYKLETISTIYALVKDLNIY